VIPSELPRAQEISVDRWALAFAALIAVATGILFGLAPAFQASRSDPQETLKENASRGVIGTRKVWLRSALVVSEVALSLVLLIGAGLLTRTFANLLGTSAGFDPHKTLSIELWMTGQNYSKPAGMAQFFQTALPRIRSMPGVEDVAVVVAGQPLETGGNWFMVPFGKDERADGFSADYREITPDYFRTLGIPMKAGREFLDSDAAGAHRVAIVNEAFAQHVFPHMNPLGQVINIAPETKNGELWEIAGVSSDAKSSLDEPAEPTIFIPSAQAEGSETRLFNGIFPAHLLIRSAGNPASLTDAVTRELHSVDSSLPLGKAQTMQEVFSASVGDQQFNVLILAVFAGAALLLAVVGIYGVMAYSVQQRTHEIGVRMALGAQQTSILRMVLGQGLWLALIGVALGIAGALGVTRVLSSMLFGVKSTDPWTFAGVSLGLLAVALLASYIPARRAMRVDPMVALRYE
jgi:putative ABC transport system permease protein